MPIESWFPVGLELPDGCKLRLARQEGKDWQIFETYKKMKALIVKEKLAIQWLQSGVVVDGNFDKFRFNNQSYMSLSCRQGITLSSVSECAVPDSINAAMAFAKSLKATRLIDAESSLADGLYVEKISRILPTHELSPAVEDSIVLGHWLTGVRIPIESTRRLTSLLGWMPPDEITNVLDAAGFEFKLDSRKSARNSGPSPENKDGFQLVGRPELEQFFNEHVIEIIENSERYRKLGIEFPSAMILHGLPGCGKTFAVEKLVEHLDWPSYSIEASSVASPYIHETSKKVAELFTAAMDNAPSVLIIDEMESFLSDRKGGQHHNVEEVAEFLRRIPEAVANQVLVIAMTNRIEMIDTAITRRGRFDHIVEVKMASEDEVEALLAFLVKDLPCDADIDVSVIAKALAGRPMSDITFVVREAARYTAKAGEDSIGQDALLRAVASAPQRNKVENKRRRIGFI